MADLDNNATVTTLSEEVDITTVPTYITGAWALAYIEACSTEIQTRFASICARRGITISNNSNVLKTAQLAVFMEAV